ncbi:hypothetical protein [Xanthomonas oryzae]|uniref:hypothetical protein n=1 Tax=Xanthomonas oryzae TaxID=347 RepID=UPI0006ABF177|nr:hypothetical protein [Xanthomonas oryzae]QBG92172.1 hypothetical protein EYR26_12020 [Xanthomonas oryzae]UNE64543.1 hypothetical protein MML47_10940 [Xanthomonas oryzae]
MLYEEKYVAFIDMLGFSELVRQSASDASRLDEISEAIDRLKNTACHNPSTGLLCTYFSDCIVISSNRTSAGLRDILHSIRAVAENLLVVDILIRGGLTVGSLHHDEQMMFGPAMICAYNMESNEACHPMVLVCGTVRTDAEAAGLSRELIWDDEDPERHYVHYLISYSTYDPTPRAGTLILDSQANLVRHFIARRLQAPPGRVREKAEWMERYWNETVGISGILGSVDRVTDLVKPNARPFRSRLAVLAPSPVIPSAGLSEE